MKPHGRTGRPLTPRQVESLTAVTEPWLSCDACFDQIDPAIDALADGADHLDQPLRVHLARCPACLEEAETLLALAAAERHADPGQLLTRLHTLVLPATPPHSDEPQPAARSRIFTNGRHRRRA